MTSSPELVSRLDHSDLILAIIDVQQKLLPALPPAVQADLEKNLKTVAELARQLDLPVLLTEQYPRGLGPTAPWLAERLETRPIEKTCFSAFGAPGFRDALAASGRRHVVVCGLEAHICVQQTTLDLLSAGYHVSTLVDAVASRQKLHWRQACERMKDASATLTNVESLAFSCLGEAGGPAFKAISKAIR
jgi:nicotinamidase-related amidase